MCDILTCTHVGFAYRVVVRYSVYDPDARQMAIRRCGMLGCTQARGVSVMTEGRRAVSPTGNHVIGHVMCTSHGSGKPSVPSSTNLGAGHSNVPELEAWSLPPMLSLDPEVPNPGNKSTYGDVGGRCMIG